MTPRELLGVAEVPGGPPLRLFRRGGDFMIVLERNELMSTRMNGSEIALGTMTCGRLAGRAAPRLLIGGYGMGFTLRAVLGLLDAKARVVVAELVPGIVDWARGPMADLTGGCLDDPRVDLRLTDVGAVLDAPEDGYDAILLDVDNGPDGLTRPANDGLYTSRGLSRARMALRPGGILAIWSAAPDAAFARRLAHAGFIVDEVRTKARDNGKGPTHVIWFATRR
ncbi:spermidine synthase [Sphingomonas sp. Leaf343]|uniref:spermidine synthase n=1 Tax=Sphingomonas sp. Leaf343 TaxID=1736345 RepID=UPI0006FE64D9|nr:spermidine synthase [Sphingomonas sp. Leaf343]KQR81331.1 spermidine synthase [Sphingomonas sp. Leaf343]